MKSNSLFLLPTLLVLASCAGSQSSDFTRGIGVYPGKLSEYSGPEMVTDNSTYRNLAFRRAAYGSSTYDYNLTAQLATDGKIAAEAPYHLSVVTSDGPVAKRDRERLFDDNTTNIAVKPNEGAFIQFNLHNGAASAESVVFTGSLDCDPDNPTGYEISIEATEDGRTWELLKEFKGAGLPGLERNDRHQGPVGGGSQNVSVEAGLKAPTPTPSAAQMTPEMRAYMLQRARQMRRTRGFEYSADIPEGRKYTSFRMRMSSATVTNWSVQEANFVNDGKEVSVLPSYGFDSAWMSDGGSNEWLYVDLGANAKFDKVCLYWNERPFSGIIESSDDGQTWTKIAELPLNEGAKDEISVNGSGRYVRLSSLEANAAGHIVLSEIEVFGRGGVKPEAQPQAPADGNRLYLSRGNWRLERSSEVSASGEQISTAGFASDSWMIATVPGTVAASYFNAGAIADIRYDDDQLQISEAYFYSDFWYRDEFEIPAEFAGSELVLNFDGINWKADIWFNGAFVGHIDGAFRRGKFDVTKLAKAGTNALAVKIIKNDHPGIIKEQTRQYTDTNGGVLGADNPTMHATVGWDWIPTVRGRNIGIYNDVYLSAYKGGVSIDDVYVETDLPLPSTEYAELKPLVTLTNHSSAEKSVELKLNYGDVTLEGKAVLAAGETKDVEVPAVRMDKPNLWWPKGYGDPYLYDVLTQATVDSVVSDTKAQKMGVREMSYTTDGGILDMFINGRRLIGNGGNWGYPEIYNNYRAREYDIAVALHADMNFTMIRNWVGMTPDQEFFEACDRHGVTVWQDFWLANPVDGPNPYDDPMFLTTAADFIRSIRNHPSLAIYIGRNEGNPPAFIDEGLTKLVEELHPGMYYYPNSASGMVSGGGPYRALAVEEYFGATRGNDRFHSERGMPNVMTYESMSRMLRKENQWPQTSVWGIHDYTLENAQSAATFNQMINTAFGEPKDLKQFTQWAQWINYNGYRAIFESRGANRKGVQLWMSHSCWPSMVWQTYDYYFEPTAAYFGSKKGSAPIRIQWNPVTMNVEVVNNNASDQAGLTAYAAIVNYDGKIIFENSAPLDSKDDTTTPVFPLSFDMAELSDAYYIKLKLSQGETLLADNFYWEGKEKGNYKQLLQLPLVEPELKTKFTCENGEWKAVATVKNTAETPALMLRLKVEGARSGASILPVFYEDNFFSLLPGETKTVTISFKNADTAGEKPVIRMEGFNIK